MARERRQFSAEYKREAVRLVEEGRSVLDVARNLGIRADMLRKWRRQLTLADNAVEAQQLADRCPMRRPFVPALGARPNYFSDTTGKFCTK